MTWKAVALKVGIYAAKLLGRKVLTPPTAPSAAPIPATLKPRKRAARATSAARSRR
jgi:hypothetical protein